MITDPMFYAVAVPAVALNGLSKGGFGGAFGFASVPLMALVISPVQAAGIMLPILLVMDAVAVWSLRHSFERHVVLALAPGALAGTALGWATASLVSDDMVRLVVGGIAVAFLVRSLLADRRRAAGSAPPAPRPRIGGAGLWGLLAGYTSFVAHAGGPPFQAHVVPLRLAPVIYAGTSAVFFAGLNSVKVIPYAALGQFDAVNLATAAVLAPLAVLSTALGVRLVRVIDDRLFYRVIFVSVFLIAVKLIADGIAGMAAG